MTNNLDTTRSPSHPTLLLIDVQQGLDDPWFGHRNNPAAEENILRLLTRWRQQQWPVVHVQHASINPLSPLHPEQPGYKLKDQTAPQADERCFVKQVNSAFIGTELEKHLNNTGTDTLVVCGLTAEHCVSTSVRHAGNLGFNVMLAADATASFDSTDHNGKHFPAQQVYDISLSTLNGEFCTVSATEEIIARCGNVSAGA